MKVLVTGSEGSLMQWVIPHLLEEGHEVVGVDNHPNIVLGKKQGYKDTKADQKIGEHLQSGEFDEANQAMDKEYGMADAQALYKTNPSAGAAAIKRIQERKVNRLMRGSAPLNFYWKSMSKKDKAGYLESLYQHNYTAVDLQEALDAEAIEFENSPD